MYAESIVKERLAIAAEELGYIPVYHSPSDVDTFIHQINQGMKLDSSGKPFFGRNLSPEEYRFIENERILCACDAAYWLTRYAWVSDENNNAVRFKFRGAQHIYFQVMSELEAARASIEMFIAKGRQQYITTITELLAGHRVWFYHYTNCFVASADRDKSSEMMRKALFAYDHMPQWLKPKHSRRIEGIPGLLEFDTLDSRMTVVHGAGSARSKGAQKTGIARGTTPTVYHLSEVSAYPNPEQQIEAAIFRSVHASAKVFGVLESTFAGDRGWFPDKYKFARDNYAKGLSRFCALFFPWPCAREIYPTPTWWHMFGKHKPPGWKPEGIVEEQILKAELFIRNNPLLSKHMGRDWVMPVEQQWFYNVQFHEAERSGTLSTLTQEMPCDDVEAMVSSYDNVFGRETIELAHETREKRFDVFALVGQAIDDKYEPDTDEIDYDRPRITFNHTTRKGDVYQWQLVPLKYERYANLTGTDDERPLVDTKLFVYRKPEEDFEYSIGADASNGIGRDASVVSVNRVGKPGCPDIQVAEFRSHYVNHVELYAFVMPIALYFKGRTSDPMKWPKFAVEQLASVGDVCQNELRKLGYPLGRMFRFGRYDGVELKQKTNKVGWFSTGWSRPMLIGKFVHVVKNNWYELNSPFTIEECRQFEIHYTESGKEKLEHARKSWDDGIFGTSIAYFIVHDQDSLAENARKQVRGPDSELVLPDVDLEPIGNFVNTRTKVLSLDEVINSMPSSRGMRWG